MSYNQINIDVLSNNFYIKILNNKTRKEWLDKIIKSFSEYEYSIKGETKDNILRIISKREIITAKDISKIIRRDPTTADFHLKKLFKGGLIDCNKSNGINTYSIKGMKNEDIVNTL